MKCRWFFTPTLYIPFIFPIQCFFAFVSIFLEIADRKIVLHFACAMPQAFHYIIFKSNETIIKNNEEKAK